MAEDGEHDQSAAMAAPVMPLWTINNADIPECSPSSHCATRSFSPEACFPSQWGATKPYARQGRQVRDDRVIGVVTQRRAEEEDPGCSDLYAGMGRVARIVKLLKMGEDNYSLVVQGLARFRVLQLVQDSPYFKSPHRCGGRADD